MVDKQTIDIGKLMEMEEFQSIIDVVDYLESKCDRGCEFYSEHPEMANFDRGRKTAFNDLRNYLSNVKVTIEKYAERNTQ